jgi:hypothetical protein
MPVRMLRRLAPLALWLCAAIAHAGPALKILATDPAPDALLARQQPFYIRFAVTATTPVIVTVSGWLNGKPVLDDGGSGAPAQLPAGGTGVVSFFYWGERPTRIDEVRLHLTDAKSGTKMDDYAFPVALTWLADDPPLREPAAWVKEWQQATAPPAGVTIGMDPSLPPAAKWLALAGGAVLLVLALRWWKRRRTRR